MLSAKNTDSNNTFNIKSTYRTFWKRQNYCIKTGNKSVVSRHRECEEFLIASGQHEGALVVRALFCILTVAVASELYAFVTAQKRGHAWACTHRHTHLLYLN